MLYRHNYKLRFLARIPNFVDPLSCPDITNVRNSLIQYYICCADLVKGGFQMLFGTCIFMIAQRYFEHIYNINIGHQVAKI